MSAERYIQEALQGLLPAAVGRCEGVSNEPYIAGKFSRSYRRNEDQGRDRPGIRAGARSLRFDYYGIVRQPKPNENPLSLRCSWPLAGRLAANLHQEEIRHHRSDYIRYLGHAQRGFRWRDAVVAFRSDPHRKRMERMMVEARGHGLHDGYIFPVHGRRGYSAT